MLFALLLPLFLGLGALAVDVGYWYVVKKEAQDAADAAALAAARDLGKGQPVATQTAIEYVRSNLPDASPPEVEFPDQRKIEVTVTQSTGTFFGRLFGVLAPTVSRRAVAERIEGGRNLAIFSHNYHGCSDGLEIDAIDTWIDGLVHSNGEYDVHAGPGNEALWAADGTIWRENCVSKLDPVPEGAVYGPGPDFLPRDVWQMANWPAWHTPADFGWPTCSGADFSGRTIEIAATEIRISDPDRVIPIVSVIPSGTYCATESLTIVGDDLRGTLSALAPQITVSGEHLHLQPFAAGMLFFSVPNADSGPSNDGSLGAGGNATCIPSAGNDLQLDGDHQNWAGDIFDPCGRVVLNTGESTIRASIVASEVRVTGDHLRLIGTGELEASVSLVE